MSTCQKCGAEVKDGAKFCQHCGAEMVIEEEVNEFKFCSNCGFKMDVNTKFCPECGTSTTGVPQTTNNSVTNVDKSPILAAVLSFIIIGLGQVYLGLTKKGIILFFAAIVSGVLMSVIIGYVAWLIVWGYAIYDGYNSAEKINNGLVVEDTIDFNNLF